MIRFLIALLCACGLSAPLHAAWRVAETDHFVLYADDSEEDMIQFADMLERYHRSMELLTGRTVPPPSPSNRLTIYAVGSSSRLSRLYGEGGRSVGGFYVARASGSIAFVPDARPTTRDLSFQVIVLLHEYTHHFLISSTPQKLPRWFSEGAAEFFASAKFPKDGTVRVGRPATHRVAELSYSRDVPIRLLLDDAAYTASRRSITNDDYYGRSWALYHMLVFEPERKQQLARYAQNLTLNMTQIDAAEAAFGDLDQLESDLNGYLRRRRLKVFEFPAAAFTTKPATVRALSAGMNDVMDLLIVSKRGVDHEEALKILPEFREVAAAHPNDAGVLTALAEAEFDAGNDAEAIAAADRALALNPASKNAYVQKGYALFRQASASDAADKTALYDAAMKPFTALNALENDHPLPLIYFFRSYAERGAEPTDLARHALERAWELAPYDNSLAMNVAVMHAAEGKIELARIGLSRLAALPHGGYLAQMAQSFLTVLEGREEGTPVEIDFQSEQVEDDPADG